MKRRLNYQVSRKRSSKFDRKRKKLAWKRRFIFLALLGGAACVLLLPTQLRIWKLEGQLKDYRQQEQVLQAKKQEIGKKIDYFASDAYIEERARHELGLVKPGEIPIFPGVPGQVQAAPKNSHEVRD